MLAAFWLLLVTLVRSFHGHGTPFAPFVLPGCAALALGTFQGPVQAFPAVNELLDRGGDAGDVIVNLHAQLNMLGGLMVILIGAALALTPGGSARRARCSSVSASGMAVYYGGGIAFAAVGLRTASPSGGPFGAAVAALEPWQALVLVPAALQCCSGSARTHAPLWRATAAYRAEGRRSSPARPLGVRRSHPEARSPAAAGSCRRLRGADGPARVPRARLVLRRLSACRYRPSCSSGRRSPGPLFRLPSRPSRTVRSPMSAGRPSSIWLPASTLVSTAPPYLAHRRRRLRLLGSPPRRGKLPRSYRTRVAVSVGAIGLLLVALPFVPAVAGIGGASVRYAYQTGFTREVTGQFIATPRGTIKLFAWSDPQSTFPGGRTASACVRPQALRVRAAAVDASACVPAVRSRRASRPASRSPELPARADPRAQTSNSPLAATSSRRATKACSGAATSRISGRRAGRAGDADLASCARTFAPAVAHALPPVAAALLAIAFALFSLARYCAAWRGRRLCGRSALRSSQWPR